MSKKILIDSNYLAYRAHLTTGKLQYGNIRTGIMYGFLSQLITVAEELESSNFLFFWDSKKSRRREIFPDYKIKRRDTQTPEEEQEWKTAFAQFNQLRKKILPNIGFINQFYQSGYESDDTIAQYILDNKDKEMYIVTSDNDMLQLLDYCKIYNPVKKATMTKQVFKKAYGIEPQQWKEVKAIAGCASDKVPGIPNVGEKKAIQFLKGEMKRTTKAYQSIKDGKEVIERNRKLVYLPFEGTKSFKEVSNEFRMLEFLRVCREFGLESFRQEKRKEKIKQLFKGV